MQALASSLWQQALARSLAAQDQGSAARFRTWLALLKREQGQYEQAKAWLEESLVVFHDLGDPGGVAHALLALGDVARDLGDAEQSIAYSSQSLELFRELDDGSFVGFSLHNLAVAAWRQGDHAQAEKLLAEARELVPPNVGTKEVLISVGLVALDQRDYTRAEQLLTESLRLGWSGKGTWLTAASLEGIAGVAVGGGRMERAARLFGAAAAVRSRIGTPITLFHREMYERHVAMARTALGEVQFEQHWKLGRAMSMQEAVAFALQEFSAR